MRKASVKKKREGLRAEYDLSQLKGGVRGKYYRQATTVRCNRFLGVRASKRRRAHAAGPRSVPGHHVFRLTVRVGGGDACLGLDVDGDGEIATNELIAGINRLVEAVESGLNGCR
jgi:hypothetical protein